MTATATLPFPAIRVHEADNVVVAPVTLPAGARVVSGRTVAATAEPVPAGHKMAVEAIAAGDSVRKFGFAIGCATRDIAPGQHVHTHNLRSAIPLAGEYSYQPVSPPYAKKRTVSDATFLGYRRSNGAVGTRNEIWVINTVGCVNRAAERVARTASERFAGRCDGFHAFSHPYGCSQLGADLDDTRRLLAGLLRHPNAGGVLVMGLGCENNQLRELLAQAGDVDPARIRAFNAQEVDDEEAAGLRAIEELLEAMAADTRTPCPVSALTLGLKCGGSDALSGLTANPMVGRIADRVTWLGGCAILAETPEIFGAEQILMNRAVSEPVFHDLVALVQRFKRYFTEHGQPVHENPSPGNIEGGLTTLEEKSLGAVQKGGHAAVSEVLDYGAAATQPGLAVLESPGNDAVSSTALVAAGATVLLFTTGRGTPLGFPVPTFKIASNSELARRKPHWIDFDAGALLDGDASPDAMAEDLFNAVLAVASGRRTRNEEHGYREIALWKRGVTL